ncbi:MAG: AMP-binding protein, partial [Beijerinckiaceae bacterium]
MLQPADTYDALLAGFRWRIPARYNIAASCCDAWAAADADRVAVIDVRPDGGTDVLTYGALRDMADRFAGALAARGLKPGDRVAIMLPQGRQVPVAHMAVYKLGAIAVPLANVFGVDAITYRLQDSGAAALVTNAAGLAKARAISTVERAPLLIS